MIKQPGRPHGSRTGHVAGREQLRKDGNPKRSEIGICKEIKDSIGSGEADRCDGKDSPQRRLGDLIHSKQCPSTDQRDQEAPGLK